MPKHDTGRHVFTDYVVSLGDDGEPPDVESYEEVCRHLGKALASELKRRGLWRLPPTLLGVAGHSWSEREAVDELARDAYVFNFVRRLRGLKNQLILKPNIDGLVALNVKNFVTARQKETDPVGYRVFARLRGAIWQTVESGEIFVRGGASGESSLTNDTILEFDQDGAPLASSATLEEHVRRWNDELFPDLIRAEGRSVPKLIERLALRIVRLRDHDVRPFRVGDLVDVMKKDVRQRCADTLTELQAVSGGAG